MSKLGIRGNITGGSEAVDDESTVVGVTGTPAGAVDTGWHHDSRVKTKRVATKRNDDSINKGCVLLAK